MSQPEYNINLNGSIQFTVPPDWFATVSAVFRKDYDQVMMIRSDGESASAIFQSSGVNNDSSRQHQLEGSSTFATAAKEKPLHLDINFYHPQSEGQKSHLCKLIDPGYMSSNISVMVSNKPDKPSLQSLDFITYFVFVEDPHRHGEDLTDKCERCQINSSVAIVQIVKSNASNSLDEISERDLESSAPSATPTNEEFKTPNPEEPVPIEIVQEEVVEGPEEPEPPLSSEIPDSEESDTKEPVDSAATTAEQWASEEVQIRSKLESIGGCSNGYAWNRIDGGWQCSGGGHTVTDDQLA